MSWNPTEALFMSIDEWEKEATPWVTNKSSIYFELNFKLGVEGMDVNKLKDRISYLIDNEKIHEDFLIKSLIKEVTELLQHQIEGQGAAIITNESFLLNMPKYAEKIKVTSEEVKENTIKMHEEILDRLKQPDYHIQAQLELDVWNHIIAKNYSKTKRKEWEEREMGKWFKGKGLS